MGSEGGLVFPCYQTMLSWGLGQRICDSFYRRLCYTVILCPPSIFPKHNVLQHPLIIGICLCPTDTWLHAVCLHVLSSFFLNSLLLNTYSHLSFLDGQSTPFSSFFLPYPDDLTVLLPLEVWKDEIFWSEKEVFSPTIRPLLPFLPGD